MTAKALKNVVTMADLLARMGDIDPSRLRLRPPPGKATRADVTRIHDREGRLYELIDGCLVEKVMGYKEGYLAMRIGSLLGNFAEDKELGAVAGADATIAIFPDMVRIPDVSYTAWERFPDRKLPDEAIPDLVPDLAVEVLSRSNTRKEMQIKLKDYFLAGVRLVWYVDPEDRTVRVYTAPDKVVTLTEADTLDGGDVLPGFTLAVRDIFAKLR